MPSKPARDGESSELSADGRQWVWISFAPEFRLILAAFVGPRTFESALQLIQMTAAVVLGVPCFFSDGIQLLPLGTDRSLPYPEDLSTHRQAGPSQAPGEGAPLIWPMGRWSKKKHQGRLQELRLSCTLRFQRLEELGLSISPSLLERLNLTLRQALAPLVRKSGSFCKTHPNEAACGSLSGLLQLRPTAYEFARASV